MKKLFAIAAAAILLPTFGAKTIHTWFDMDIADIPSVTRNWPTDGSDYLATFCTTTNTAAGTFADHRINIKAKEPMTVITDAPAAINDATYAEITATMKMTPFLESSLPDVPEGAKTAVIAVDSGASTNFWVAAGIDELQWVDTGIAADVSRDVLVKIVSSNGVDRTYTEWTFDGTAYSQHVIAKTMKLQGVSFIGEGELSQCGGDVYNIGLAYFFQIAGVPSDITVVVTNAYGEEVVKGKQQLGEEIGYTYVKDSVLGLSFITPPGWPYYDGTTLRTDIYTNNIDNNVYTPFGGYGIIPLDYGPVNGWCVAAANADGEPEFVGRFASTADALAALKHNYGMIPYYSEFEHTVTVSGDGKSITIDEVTTPAKERYHYLDAEGVPMLFIDDGEADITSVREDETDAALMSIGSVLNTFSGFDYSVIYADDVGFTEGLGETEPVKGNGEKLELTAPKGDAGKRFYRIRITD